MRHAVLLSLCAAVFLRPKITTIVRDAISASGAVDGFVSVSDAVLNGQIAFTAPDNRRVFIDLDRLKDTPNTLFNVIRHEIGHTQGMTHGDGNPEMIYSVQTDQLGIVFDDNFHI